MKIHIRRVRGTPYKIVFANGNEAIGIFDHGFYVARENMNDDLKQVVAQFHADTLSERVEEFAHETS